MSSASRIATYAAFWPYYIGEHRDARCRITHFVGTLGFLGSAAACLYDAPLRFGAALVVGMVVATGVFSREGRRPLWWPLLGFIGVTAYAHPYILAGIVFAYFWAWVGHFLLEHNRPATFRYPLWSLASDFRMWGAMLRGRGWRGDGSDIL